MKNAHSITRDFEVALCEYTGAPYAVAVSSCTMALLLAVRWCLRTGNVPQVDVEDMYLSARAINALCNSGVGGLRDLLYLTRKDLLRFPNLGAHTLHEIENEVARLGYSLGTQRSRDHEPISLPKRTYISVPMSVIHAGGKPVFRDEVWVGAYQLKTLPVFDCARRFTSGMYRQGQFQCVSFHWAKILGDTQGGAILHDSKDADAWFRRARFDGRTEDVSPKYDKFDIMGWHCYMSPDVSTRLLGKLSVLPRQNDDLPNDDYPDLSLIRWSELQ